MKGSSTTRDVEASRSRSTVETTAGQCSSEALPDKSYLPKGLTPWLVLLIAILWHSADRLIIPPLNRLLEANICRVYYREHHPSFIDENDQVPEYMCKVNSIQIQLALLLGAIQTTGLVCGKLILSPDSALSRNLTDSFLGIRTSLHFSAWLCIRQIRSKNHSIYQSRLHGIGVRLGNDCW